MKTQRHREKPCKDKGRVWNNASRSHGMPRIIDHHRKPGGRQGTDFSAEPSENTNPANSLSADFSNLQNMKEYLSLVLSFPGLLCHSSLREVTQSAFSVFASMPIKVSKGFTKKKTLHVVVRESRVRIPHSCHSLAMYSVCLVNLSKTLLLHLWNRDNHITLAEIPYTLDSLHRLYHFILCMSFNTYFLVVKVVA